MISKSSNLLILMVLMGALLLPGCANEKRIVRMVDGKPVCFRRMDRLEKTDKNVPLGIAQGTGAAASGTVGIVSAALGVGSAVTVVSIVKTAGLKGFVLGLLCAAPLTLTSAGCCCFSIGCFWLANKLGKHAYQNCTGECVVDEYVEEIPATVGVANEFEIKNNKN